MSKPQTSHEPKVSKQPQEAARQELEAGLRGTPFLSHGHPRFMHGRAYEGPMTPAQPAWVSNDKPRDDHDAPNWLTATEFVDVPEVALAKMKQLAQLLLLSRRTVLYTGAGISASAVGQAARSGLNKQGWLGNTREAQPTPTHLALGVLGRAGLVASWVQQNHDGLPQKAGFPQERICEVHGSWYDPSNPVVKYSGCLKDAEYAWLEREMTAADLVLVLGTSLGGLSADALASECAERTRRAPGRGGGGLGVACINLQQTAHDGTMSLRAFGRSDDLLRLLLGALAEQGAALPPLPRPGRPAGVVWPAESVVLVPYDAAGRRLPQAKGAVEGEVEGAAAALGPRAAAARAAGTRMYLDLRPGAKVRLTPGHNIQGAKQPQYMHIGASRPVTHPPAGGEGASRCVRMALRLSWYRGVTRQPGSGVGTVVKRDEPSSSFVLQVDGETMRLGLWWLEAAQRGGPEGLPLVNVRPQYEGDEAPPGLVRGAQRGGRPEARATRPCAAATKSGRGGARGSAPKAEQSAARAVTSLAEAYESVGAAGA